ncbi:MAG: formate/nitrite transporter family protein [Anaerolineaceae bacterium]|jgi:formate/nitrite transporter
MTDLNRSVICEDLSPEQVAHRTVEIGVSKTQYRFGKSFTLAIFAGIFIAFAVLVSTFVTTNGAEVPYGVGTFLKGLSFSVGLVMVLVAGAELFTGNNLILMAVLQKKVKLSAMLKNLLVVYLGNFVGSLLIALAVIGAKQYTSGAGEVGRNLLILAQQKTSLGFTQALILGIQCNVLVCTAVWMSYTTRMTVGKIAAVFLPIFAFVASGMEHSVANMFYIPAALLMKLFDPAFVSGAGNFPNLTLEGLFIGNLLPVTLGNMIGGMLVIAAGYWFVFLRKADKK